MHGRLKTVACLTMYGHYCPACETARAHFRNNENSQGKALYRRREYLARVAVVASPLVLDESGIKLISLGPRLFDTVQKRLGGSELQYPPHDPDEGRDFHIAKSLREGRFSYHLSHFDEVSRPLDEAWKALLPSTPLSAERTPEVSLSGMDYMLGLSQKQKKTAVRERAFTRFKFETLSQPPMTP